MTPRERLEATYDAMPPAVMERAYGDPLARRLNEAAAGVAFMGRLIREDIGNIRALPNSPKNPARRTDIAALWRRRRQHQADKRLYRLLIEQRTMQRNLMGE